MIEALVWQFFSFGIWPYAVAAVALAAGVTQRLSIILGALVLISLIVVGIDVHCANAITSAGQLAASKQLAESLDAMVNGAEAHETPAGRHLPSGSSVQALVEDVRQEKITREEAVEKLRHIAWGVEEELVPEYGAVYAIGVIFQVAIVNFCMVPIIGLPTLLLKISWRGR